MSREWFEEHFKATSPAFEAWWLAFYGKPDDYDGFQSEQDEYWIRKGFAWHGWKARAES